ncbi:DUF4276 family protein [Streptomyces sp. 8P21H-1]|uniref:DUF4276 family protein n=1 Tax=Streptomyces sp. 8P21H-1 TaxID=2737048 RepID=UPI00156EF275|nr:DUF4276 family protein [Streptomyces sp. 8P21H-1]
MTIPYPVIAPVVEGHGEEKALQGLLHRLVPHLREGAYADIQPAYRLPHDRMLKLEPLSQALTIVTARRPCPTAVLVLLDADDDCAVELATQIHSLARNSHAHVPLTAVVAVREFEAWFLAGRMGLPHDLAPPPNPEAIRGAKEWLSDRMPLGSTYRPPAHQPSFVQYFDLDAARHAAPSFDKLCREILRFLERPTAEREGEAL